jgi:transposase
LKELGRSYATITKDLTRVMNRIKALYRSWAVPCSGSAVYAPRHRAEWLGKIVEPGVRIRAEHLYQQLDSLQSHPPGSATRATAGESEACSGEATAPDSWHRPDSGSLAGGIVADPHRFRTKRQLWAAYSGFAVETHDSGEYRWVRGKLQRNRERITVRGLNDNHNKDLKNLFKSAAVSASTRPGPLHDFYVALVTKGMRPTMARLTLARKLAAITLTMWKKGVDFDPKQVQQQAA